MSLDDDPTPYRFRFIFAKDDSVLRVSASPAWWSSLSDHEARAAQAGDCVRVGTFPFSREPMNTYHHASQFPPTRQCSPLILVAFLGLRAFNPSLAFAASLASFLLFSSFAFFSAGDSGMSSSLTPYAPTDAPRILSRPSFSVSVMTGEAAGRYLCSSE